MTCNHKHYKEPHHMTASKALRMMKDGKIVWMSKTIKNCNQCGADISYANVVEVKTFEEYMR